MLLAQWTLVFLIYLAWQCDITSFLTRKSYHPRIKSLVELAEDLSVKPVIVKGSGVYEFFEVCCYFSWVIYPEFGGEKIS